MSNRIFELSKRRRRLVSTVLLIENLLLLAKSFVNKRICVGPMMNVLEIPVLLTEPINFCTFLFKHIVKEVHSGQVSYLVDNCPKHEVFENFSDVPLKNDRQHNLL